jgi:4-amino-4-deoxy-L-arabinose transferase-like glycosyltransferase
VPTLAGEPYMDKPPLFYWTAALFAKLWAPLLPLHDGARLASGFYTALTLLFTGLAGRRLYGENRGWAAAIILIGCLGMLVRAHEMITDLALLTGCAMMLYGFTLSRERVVRAGILIGTGVGIGFMAKGFIAPVAVHSYRRCCPHCSGLARAQYLQPRHRRPVRRAVADHPPLLLYQHSRNCSPTGHGTHNIGNWLDYAKAGPGMEAFYYLKSLPWLAWPALPLAFWVVWKSRKRLAQRDDLQLPLVSFAVMLVTLSLVPNIKEVYALPMLLPIAFLASASLSILKRGAANALDWFGITTFAFAIMMWWGWAGFCSTPGQDPHWLKGLAGPTRNANAPFVIAIIATVLWLVLVWRVGRSMRRAVVNWAAGVTLIWTLAMTLWLPWLDSGKSYRNMVAALKQAMPKQYQCVAGEYLGDGQRAMLHYFGDIITRRDAKQRCDLRLIQGDKLSKPLLNETRWKKIWEGSRKGDKNEHYRLYQRIS